MTPGTEPQSPKRTRGSGSKWFFVLLAIFLLYGGTFLMSNWELVFELLPKTDITRQMFEEVEEQRTETEPKRRQGAGAALAAIVEGAKSPASAPEPSATTPKPDPGPSEPINPPEPEEKQAPE